VLANPSAETVEFAINGGGLASNLKLRAGALTSVLVTEGVVKITTQKGSVAGALIVDVDSAVTAISLVEYRNLGGLISVVVR
jgi:hypothetical protein